MKRRFSNDIGPSKLLVDGFLTLNPQASEAHLLPLPFRAINRISEMVKGISKSLPDLVFVADSIYVNSAKANT